MNYCIDSDIDDSGKATGGSTVVGGGGSGMTTGAGVSTFGSSQKIGFGTTSGFGGLGSNAPYGGAFNNSMLPERVGSSTPNDISVR